MTSVAFVVAALETNVQCGTRLIKKALEARGAVPWSGDRAGNRLNRGGGVRFYRLKWACGGLHCIS